MKSTGLRPQTRCPAAKATHSSSRVSCRTGTPARARHLQDPVEPGVRNHHGGARVAGKEHVGEPALPGLRGREPVRVGVGARQRASSSVSPSPRRPASTPRAGRGAAPCRQSSSGISSTNTMLRGRLKLESVPAVAQSRGRAPRSARGRIGRRRPTPHCRGARREGRPHSLGHARALSERRLRPRSGGRSRRR